jgi:hypothetical protein
MTQKHRRIAAALALCLLVSAVFAQRALRRTVPVPEPDRARAGERKEWTFARLVYDGGNGRSSWSVDYPVAEYHLSGAVRRLTRVDADQDGEIVSPNSDQLFDYPWLYAVEVGSWGFSADQAARMREYLLRGGFLMVDDFHGESEWEDFMIGMRAIFPDREVEEVPPTDLVYAMPYPQKERVQVPGPRYMNTGLTYERQDGVTPHWRGIRDDQKRWMVLISHNIDYGEGWEQADNPAYPEEFTRQAYEVAIDYLLYAMSH